MNTLFRPASYKVQGEKWKSKYYTIKKEGDDIVEQEHYLKGDFDSKEAANKFAEEYCKQKGYLPVKK